MANNNVVGFGKTKRQREMAKLEGELKLFSGVRSSYNPVLYLPYDDITRVHETEEPGLSDKIVMGNKAEAAIKEMYRQFGIEGMPETWGELIGSVNYCMHLNRYAKWSDCKTEDDKLMFKACQSVAEEYTPDLVPSFDAYVAKDFDELRRISREVLTLPEMSKRYNYKPEPC